MKNIVIKFIAAALVFAMAVGLAACAKKPSSNALNTEPPVSTNTQDPNSVHKDETSDGGAKQTESIQDGGHVIGPAGPSTYVVKSEDGFYSSGFTCFKPGKNATLEVEFDDSEGAVEWGVYVLDKEFTDAQRYILSAYEPTLTENGTIDVQAGQFVYVYCSVNAFSAEKPFTGATVSFTGEGLPKQ